MELLVVVTVIILLSGMVILYNRRSENTIALYRDQAKIVAVLNRAKGLAIQTFNEQGYVPCGFGVHFEQSGKFFIFRDSHSSDPGVCDAIYTKEKGEEMTDETHILFSRVIFENVPFDVVFKPPEPQTFIKGASGYGLSMEIGLISGNSERRKIRVTGAGQITVDNNQ